MTLFQKKTSINVNGHLMNLESPKVMGILNITDDSFFDGGKYLNEEKYISHVGKLLSEGADIIDIGAQSSRPGSLELGKDAEIKRIVPVIQNVRKHFPKSIISVDTWHARVAEQSIISGANMINDISGGTFDIDMFNSIANLQVPYILMHTGGRPDKMQDSPNYKNVVKEVIYFLSKQLDRLNHLGINDVIIDPGFGFGKTQEHNFELMKHLDHFNFLETPILIGISRKSMIHKPLNTNANNSLNGTTALNMIALEKGASILRVHDVRQAKEVIKMYELLKQ
ncbi:MAG: dihydropteroate synthase [Bacteroidales bacterium]|nr:dihydropteroate synthase [Bacteroidales bacterium]